MQVTVPTRYGEDWYERCPSSDPAEHGNASIVKRTARHITFEVDEMALADLKSDADYYADRQGFDPEYYGLCDSAKAALRMLGAAELVDTVLANSKD